MTELAEKQLAERLEDGWQMIEQEQDGDRRERLTSHWIRLLRRYETEQDLKKDPL